MVHWIDVVHWFLDLDHPADGRERRRLVLREGRLGNARHGADADALSGQGGAGLLRGDVQQQPQRRRWSSSWAREGTLYIDRGRYEIIPDRDKKKPEPSSLILGTDQRQGLDFYDKPDGELAAPGELGRVHPRPLEEGRPCPAEAGVSAASAAHLANQSVRSGQVAVWKG